LGLAAFDATNRLGERDSQTVVFVECVGRPTNDWGEIRKSLVEDKEKKDFQKPFSL